MKQRKFYIFCFSFFRKQAVYHFVIGMREVAVNQVIYPQILVFLFRILKTNIL